MPQECRIDTTTNEILVHGVKAHAGICDLANKCAVATNIAVAAESLGGIDILVNNTSGFVASDDEDMPIAAKPRHAGSTPRGPLRTPAN